MRITALLGAFGLTAMICAGAQAQSLTCGDDYVVKRGDTLQRIATRVYGPDASWARIYNANKKVIGRNPSLIEIGMRLAVPCDGAAQAAAPTAEAASTPEPAAETAAAPTSGASGGAAPSLASMPLRGGRLLRLVTATDYAPFHDQNAEKGGMITEITSTALDTVLEKGQYRIDFINDWSAHLVPLIADHTYDFSLSWFRPNCDVIEKLSEGNRFRCENLGWSDPLFEQVISYFIRSDTQEKAATHAELFGKTFCRPSGYSTFMMEEKDLVEPNIKLERPLGPSECFEMLAEGKVDVVVLASTVADDAIAKLNLRGQVEELPQLAYVATLHAITAIDNPLLESQMAIMNEGIRNVRESGAWFEIVQRHLVEHARKTATN